MGNVTFSLVILKFRHQFLNDPVIFKTSQLRFSKKNIQEFCKTLTQYHTRTLILETSQENDNILVVRLIILYRGVYRYSVVYRYYLLSLLTVIF